MRLEFRNSRADTRPHHVTPRPRHIEQELEHYEGLIFKHATRIVGIVELELDDIRAIYRVKAWRALESFDPRRSHLPVERYVFSCLKNAEKDLLKRRRRDEAFIADLEASPRFEARYQAADHETVYFDVEDESGLVPNTLTEVELRVVLLLYSDYRQTEVARRLGMEKPEMDRLMRSIREKMSDWRPAARVDMPTRLPELPVAA